MFDGGQYGGGGGASAASLFSGGGFMPSQGTQTPESSFSKNRNAQTLLPLTVKQIIEAYQTNEDKSNFVVDGVDASTVRLLGRMVNKVERVTDVSFTLDDGTGRIDVNRWENETSATNEMVAIKNGAYVIVNGSLKGFQGKRHVVAYSVRPVNNFSDITHHFLECIHVHLEHTRSKLQANGSTAIATPFKNEVKGYQAPFSNQTPLKNEVKGNQAPFSNQTLFKNDVTGSQAPFAVNQAPMHSAFRTSSGTELSNLVLAIFNDPANVAKEHGVHVNDVINKLNLPENQIRAVIADHVEVGNIYSTIDDNHFKSACNG